MRGLFIFGALWAAAGVCVAASLPVEFSGHAPDWVAQPSFLGNPATDFSVEQKGGVATLTVRQPGKGMKFELSFQPFDADRANYLVIRYKASGLGPGYALWAQDEHPGGFEAMKTGEWQQDGQWHVLALDLFAAGVKGTVTGFLTEVEATKGPASISFDYLRLADEPPAGAKIVPAGSQAITDVRHVLHARDLKLAKQPSWLGSPATDCGARVEGGLLHLWAVGPGNGMKWSAPLPAPIDLKSVRYAAVRYRATDTAPWGDYFLWLGSAAGGTPPEATNVMPMSGLRDDGQWHVAVIPLRESFTATNLALEVSSRGARGDIWLDTITLTGRRPLLAPTDVLPIAKGWGASRLKPGSFRALALANDANSSSRDLLPRLGWSRWFGGGKLTACGIPFGLPDAGAGDAMKDVVATSENIDRVVEIPVGGRCSEVYVLMAALLPDAAYSGVLGTAPLTSFTDPERFLFRLRYADGVTDEAFPICVASDRNEVVGGAEVYCVPVARKVPLTSLGLRSRMPTATFAVAAATANEGAPVTKTPAVQGLPPYAAQGPQAGSAATTGSSIARVAGGYVIKSGPLRLDLGTGKGIVLRGLADASPGADLHAAPGPLFQLVAGKTVVGSDKVVAGAASLTRDDQGASLRVPFDATSAGVPLHGEFECLALPGGQIRMRLDTTYAGAKTGMAAVNFPLLSHLRLGSAADTWYLWTCKGGLISNQPTSSADWYGGQHPLQVADLFNPRHHLGLALFTYDRSDLYKQWHMTKDASGVDWALNYWEREYKPGEHIATAWTALRAHAGGWRVALDLYRDWAHSWYHPQVPRKKWFQAVFNYRQHLAWTELYDRKTGTWRMDQVIKADRAFFGRIDYLHIFDFGESHIYGRVGDYDHYNELGGLAKMAAAVARAQADGVRVGLYIEGYLCDIRAQWGKENVLRNALRNKGGMAVLYPGTTSEYMMCPAAIGWRDHLASVCHRVARQLKPNGLYIDEYGFLDPGKVCWSRDHGHPVPWPPITGERDTLKAIRAGVPPSIATLTEMTPNDVNSQHQDGALSYSVAWDNPDLAPERVDLFRFVFPSFKVLQLTSYNNFVNGHWGILKFPFFNGEGYWLGNPIPQGFCTDARDFLRKAFAILHDNRDAFCSDDVEPLVPTLRPTLYANRFTAGAKTVWTLFNADYATFRGDALRVPYVAGTRYVDAFSGQPIAPRIERGEAVLPVVLGPRGVGCIVATRAH